MAEFKNPSNRVFGKRVGLMNESTSTRPYSKRYANEEERAQAQKETQASYDKWLADRNARIATSRQTRVRELRHKDIIV